jgi:hypothetical protein
MTVKELIEKGYIDVNDDISFKTHAEVMRLFGKDRINPRSSFYRHPYEKVVHIWFPIFYQDEENAWENTWGLNEETTFERRKSDNEGYLKE